MKIEIMKTEHKKALILLLRKEIESNNDLIEELSKNFKKNEEEIKAWEEENMLWKTIIKEVKNES
jgi:hypothetical protein